MKNQLWSNVEVKKISQKGDKSILEIIVDSPKEDILRYASCEGLKGEIKFKDDRCISADQRKKIFATVQDMSLYTGYPAEYLRQLMTLAFCLYNDIALFSLSDCSVETAREFISYLIEFCVEQDIPLTDSLLERTDDISKYLYMTLRKEICCICGTKGVTYTLDREKNKMCLCNEHYEQAKTKGLKTFQDIYKVYGIKYVEIRSDF